MGRIVWTAVLMSLVVSSCSGAPDAGDRVPTSIGAPTPGQDVFPVIASSEIVVGDRDRVVAVPQDTGAEDPEGKPQEELK